MSSWIVNPGKPPYVTPCGPAGWSNKRISFSEQQLLCRAYFRLDIIIPSIIMRRSTTIHFCVTLYEPPICWITILIWVCICLCTHRVHHPSSYSYFPLTQLHCGCYLGMLRWILFHHCLILKGVCRYAQTINPRLSMCTNSQTWKKQSCKWSWQLQYNNILCKPCSLSFLTYCALAEKRLIRNSVLFNTLSEAQVLFMHQAHIVSFSKEVSFPFLVY